MTSKKRRTVVQELYIMDGGYIELDKSMMTFHQGRGQMIRLPVPMYLIKTEQGNILYDTGFSPARLVTRLSQMGLNPTIAEEYALPNRLKEISLTPKDIKTVILSHLHVDHAGGIQFLSEAELFVQKDEYNYAFHPHSFAQGPYLLSDFNFPSFNWELIDGDQMIMPGLAVVLANGHTPGFQALVVDLPETGVIILAGDCCPLSENIEKEIINGIVWDPTRSLHSIKKLKALAELLGGTIYPGHDIDFWQTLKKAPECYK